MARNTTTPTTVADVAKAIAKAKGTDSKVEAKKLRGYIRANFDKLATKNVWPALVDAAKENRDGNRYPPMPPKLASSIIAKRTGKADPNAKAPKAHKVTTPAPEATPDPTPAA